MPIRMVPADELYHSPRMVDFRESVHEAFLTLFELSKCGPGFKKAAFDSEAATAGHDNTFINFLGWIDDGFESLGDWKGE